MNAQTTTKRGEKYAKIMYPSRVLVYLLCLLSVSATLKLESVSFPDLFLFISLPLLWPHLVFYFVNQFTNVYAAERRMFHFDSVVAGYMVAMLGFESLATLGIFNIALITQLMVFGPIGILSHGLGVGIGYALNTFVIPYSLEAGHSTYETLCALPLLIVGPALLGINSYFVEKKLYYQRANFKSMGEKDALTKLHNRRFFKEKLQQQFEFCRKGGIKSVLILLDIDEFKRINDTHGYSVGDEVIASVAKQLLDSVRQYDVVCRYGGEEFALLLIQCGEESAVNLAEKIRVKIGARTFLGESGDFSVSVSMGVVAYDPSFKSIHEWMHHADSVLYGAKRRGKNNVSSSPINLN